ncbi:MAG: hypothetical protein IKG18_09100 [Atopobiaceae bacterium]|nr:hypothetical protein [Atopobiaceae bacterium]MBR3314279.1 hypothetical protein [Atopobiaceae bacterium]
MGGVCAIVAGSVFGVLGALPPALLFERALRGSRPVGVTFGLASIMLAFTVHVCSVFAVWIVSREDVLFFGAAEAISFLLVWVVEAVRAWRDAQRGAGPGERKSGESSR